MRSASCKSQSLRTNPRSTTALAEQTAWTLQAVDLLLIDTARWYRSDSAGIPPERLNAVLQDRTAGVQQVRQIMIVDAQGNQRYGSRGSAPPGHNVSDRSYFIAQRDGTAAGLFMSEPLVTRSEGRAAVVLSRRIDDDNGRFAGVVTAVLDLDDLKQYYQAVNVGMGTAIQLVRDDGTLLARNPPTPETARGIAARGNTSGEQDRSRQFRGDRRRNPFAPSGDEPLHQRRSGHGARRHPPCNPGTRRSE